MDLWGREDPEDRIAEEKPPDLLAEFAAVRAERHAGQ